ncbi:MAG: sulfite dehydrogenase (quinone) subunit SoeC [Pseudomonadota bacterium]|nr:sulfite dehydrogenase (quinone) subunit SoeC [Pseudomonadota bacterium]
MNPPYSVIFLTTLIGMGQGLFLALIVEQLQEQIQGISQNPLFFIVGGVIVLFLLVGGLIASFFHLGHPERAWRAAAKWRTSWLSREVIALPIFMAIVFIYTLLELMPHYNITVSFGGLAYTLSLLLGFLGLLSMLLLFICTSMIYACLRFLQQWHSPLTMINFILMGCASGFTLAATLAAAKAVATNRQFCINLAAIAFGLTFLALIFRLLSLRRNKKLRPKSTVQSALGIKNPKITQTSSGAMAPSYNRHLFSHGKTVLFIRSIKWIFLTMGFGLPLLILITQLNNTSFIIMLLALVVQYVGLVAERWYFFADANHPQNIYYQVIA